MKLEERVLEVDSTLTGERVAMSIDDNALAKIMGVLTNLYSDAELAVLREYSTNGLDAHVAAGVTRPIEVTLPTPLAPYLRIRDYGVGLDADDIRNIYSRYGTSTKDKSNDMVGQLGLGCKSALTYTDQFTLSGTKNGVTTQVSVSRDENGAGSMTIVAEYESDDPNGVEVIIPAKSNNTFAAKAAKFFRFWAPGTVLVNGEAPKRVDGLWVADDLLLTQETDRDYVVMGNVAYPMSGTAEYRNYHLVAWVNIGDVQFTPSREALKTTKETQATIQDVRERAKAATPDAVNRVIAEAKTKPEALTTAMRVSAMFGNAYKIADFKYNGQEIPMLAEPAKILTGKKGHDGNDILEYAETFTLLDAARLTSYSGRGRGKPWKDTYKIPSTLWAKTIWLVGYEDGDFSMYKKQKLTQWVAKQNFATAPETYVLCKEVPADVIDWIDPSTIKPWAEVKAEKVVRANVPRRDGRPTGSYKGYVNGQYSETILAGTIDTSNPIYYIDNNTYSRDARLFIEKFHTDYTFVRLGGNRVKKFQRDFPTAQEFHAVKHAMAQKWFDGLSHMDRLSIHLHHNESIARELIKLDAAKIEDPELRDAIVAANHQTDAVDEHQVFGRYHNADKYKPAGWKNPYIKYALLQEISFYGTMEKKVKDHLYLYINAAYAVEREN